MPNPNVRVFDAGNTSGLQMPAGYAASGGTQTAAQNYLNQNQNPSGSSGGQVASVQTKGSYTVKKGDTLWDISRKYYGSGYSWRKLLDANPNCLSRPGDVRTLRIGYVMVIPE